MNLLTANLLMSTLIFYVAARIYLLPRLQSMRPGAVMIPILLLHSMRHLGLMFLSTGGVLDGMPPGFAYPAALGDLVATLLALAAIPAVQREAPWARPLVGIFNVVGTVDLLTAITLATIHDAAPFMGAAYWIPAFWVPALLVTHYITFVLLRRPWPVAAKAEVRSRTARVSHATGAP
jgi:hypothetical protein